MRVQKSSYLLTVLTLGAIVTAGCQQEMPAPSPPEETKAIHVTAADFQEVVLDSDKPVLVDFWATWCRPCHLMDPVIQTVARDFHDKAVVAKVNFDENKGLAQEHRVIFLPTMLIFHRGEEVERFEGVVSQQTIEDALTRWTNEGTAATRNAAPTSPKRL